MLGKIAGQQMVIVTMILTTFLLLFWTDSIAKSEIWSSCSRTLPCRAHNLLITIRFIHLKGTLWVEWNGNSFLYSKNHTAPGSDTWGRGLEREVLTWLLKNGKVFKKWGHQGWFGEVGFSSLTLQAWRLGSGEVLSYSEVASNKPLWLWLHSFGRSKMIFSPNRD